MKKFILLFLLPSACFAGEITTQTGQLNSSTTSAANGNVTTASDGTLTLSMGLTVNYGSTALGSVLYDSTGSGNYTPTSVSGIVSAASGLLSYTSNGVFYIYTNGASSSGGTNAANLLTNDTRSANLSGAVTLTNVANTISGTFTGNGGGLTNLQIPLLFPLYTTATLATGVNLFQLNGAAGASTSAYAGTMISHNGYFSNCTMSLRTVSPIGSGTNLTAYLMTNAYGTSAFVATSVAISVATGNGSAQTFNPVNSSSVVSLIASPTAPIMVMWTVSNNAASSIPFGYLNGCVQFYQTP